ncbi:hypothetical protein DFR50_11443 [Roseiarcus fermentans]|uniref:Uncharacterized protein n=1 Tax=Roseiarcus fermentans TaxID=1473586 RepID=A0A366FC03_9HYPH|nr:hypothetical protein [Roseiarcus fermentans]RBP12214.1 hypothetical protein DFR50_11443 [Roseiarcus fermentans]
MTLRALALAAIACALCPAPSRAGPCADDIYKADVAIAKRLEQLAAQGKPGAESSFATTHHQPTPATIAGAEEKVGDISEAQATAVRKWMTEARKDDAAGDRESCEKALAQARGLLGM